MTDTRKLALKQDELILTKQDVLDMFDGLIKRWKKNEKANFLVIQSIRGIKLWILATPEGVVRFIWNDILKFFNKIILYNEVLKDRGEKNPMLKSFERVKAEIKEGNFD